MPRQEPRWTHSGGCRLAFIVRWGGGSKPASGPTSFAISGKVSSGSGATIDISGASTRTAVADTSGNFKVTGLAPSAYVINANSPGYVTTPASRDVTVSSSDVTGVDFALTAAPEGLPADVLQEMDNAPSSWIPDSEVILPNGQSRRTTSMSTPPPAVNGSQRTGSYLPSGESRLKKWKARCVRETLSSGHRTSSSPMRRRISSAHKELPAHVPVTSKHRVAPIRMRFRNLENTSLGQHQSALRFVPAPKDPEDPPIGTAPQPIRPRNPRNLNQRRLRTT